ncbi:MAG: cell envelope integrity protein TolA [Thermomonas sp.]|uniref:protein TolA n=1 Tax=Thermomonas sp. TaxID=1971895 RepID=UPI0039E3E442
MKQTRTDNWITVVQALGLHVLLFLLMFGGLQWTRSNTAEPSAGDPIEAELIDPSALSGAMQRALRREPEPLPQPVEEPQPQPLPEPEPEPAPQLPDVLPPPVPDPAPVEQEKVRRDAPSPDVAKVPREQDEKRRQPDQAEINARKAEQQRQEEERKRQQQIAELRKQREQAARERSMAEQREQQLRDARSGSSTSPAQPPPGNRGTDESLKARYRDALQQAITRQWVRPESVQIGQRCRILIRQLPGGDVQDVTVSPSCPFDALGRESVERAVLKASPLPYAGFELVFARELDLNFVAEER